MSEKPKRIGLWGGSFNPPTTAHKALADFAFSEIHLDEMHWIVCPHNPEKDPSTLAPFEDRLAMVKQTLSDRDNMYPNDIEHILGSSWTINTVKALRKQWPDDDLFFMMGTDNWLGFHQWGGNFAEILDYVSLVIFNRPGDHDATTAEAGKILASQKADNVTDLKKSGSWYILNNPLFDMSATQARKALADGQVPTQLAPETVNYIEQHQLYKKPL